MPKDENVYSEVEKLLESSAEGVSAGELVQQVSTITDSPEKKVKDALGELLDSGKVSVGRELKLVWQIK